jgi:hypothetical protein
MEKASDRGWDCIFSSQESSQAGLGLAFLNRSQLRPSHPYDVNPERHLQAMMLLDLNFNPVMLRTGSNEETFSLLCMTAGPSKAAVCS